MFILGQRKRYDAVRLVWWVCLRKREKGSYLFERDLICRSRERWRRLF